MPSWLTPPRRRGVEVLDDPATPDAVRECAMRDVARSNRLFGGTQAVVRALEALDRRRDSPVLLDVGTGTGDIAAQLGGDITKIGVDISVAVLRVARRRMAAVVAGDALALPLRDDCVDIVICSQVLHHFDDGDALALVRELERVSRRWIILSDLRRSWVAAAGFWLASIVLRFHPVTRHDGVVSVLRGFTPRELHRIVRSASGRDARVRRRQFWRLTVTWEKRREPRPDYS